MPPELRRFLRAAVPFTAILLTLYAGLHVASAAVAPRFVDKVLRFEKMKQKGDRIEALFVGSSLCCSADFDALGMPGYDLRHPGSDLFEAAYVARQALPHLPRLKRVLIPMGYPALHWDNSLRKEMRAEIYSIYCAYEPIGGRRDGVVTGFFGPTVRPDHFEELVSRLWKPAPPEPVIDDWGRIDPDEIEAVRSPEMLDQQSEQAVVRHLKIVASVDAARPDAAASARAELEELAELLDGRGVELVLVIPPFHESYNRRLMAEPRGAELVREIDDMLRSLQRDHSNVRFFDAARFPGITSTPNCFRSCDHLSSLGARLFCTGLARALRQPLKESR